MKNFRLYHYPKSRLATFDVGRIGYKKHHIIGLVEIDVTSAREKIRDAIKSGRKISFTSWIIKVISSTIIKNDYIHSINYKNRTQVSFNDVDISLPIEKYVEGARVPLAMVIKKTNNKTIDEINEEIQSASKQEISSEKDYVLGKKSFTILNNIFFNLPQFFRMIIWHFLLANPFIRKKNMGTAMVTNIGIAGGASGWILPKSIHNLCFGIGSITKKPWIYMNNVEIREILNLTIIFDHDVVDGVPAARFTSKLIKNIEQAMEL